MRKKLCISIGLSVVIGTVSSQNVLQNGNFENYSTLPMASGEIEKCNYWDGIVWSPDYYSQTSFLPIYQEFGGTYSGQFMIGLGTDGQDPGGTEAIGQDITLNPLLNGSVCNFGLWAKQDTWYYGSCAKIELYGFQTTQTNISNINHIEDYPGANLLWSSTTILDSVWQNYSGSFVCNGNYNYVAITISRVPFCNQYIYIDSVYLDVQDLGFTTTPILTELTIFPNPTSNSLVTLTIPENGNFENTHLEIYNQLGEIVLSLKDFTQSSISLDISSLTIGVYQLVLTNEEDRYFGRLFKI